MNISTTELTLSTKLAKAIGWKQMRVMYNRLYVAVQAPLGNDMFIPVWTEFDYRDWSVIAPIAQRYNCFPGQNKSTKFWVSSLGEQIGYASTPQEAIAEAVIDHFTNQKRTLKRQKRDGLKAWPMPVDV